MYVPVAIPAAEIAKLDNGQTRQPFVLRGDHRPKRIEICRLQSAGSAKEGLDVRINYEKRRERAT